MRDHDRLWTAVGIFASGMLCAFLIALVMPALAGCTHHGPVCGPTPTNGLVSTGGSTAGDRTCQIKR